MLVRSTRPSIAFHPSSSYRYPPPPVSHRHVEDKSSNRIRRHNYLPGPRLSASSHPRPPPPLHAYPVSVSPAQPDEARAERDQRRRLITTRGHEAGSARPHSVRGRGSNALVAPGGGETAEVPPVDASGADKVVFQGVSGPSRSIEALGIFFSRQHVQERIVYK